MPVQRTNCVAIVRKTTLQEVMDGLSATDVRILEEILAEDTAVSKVKHFVERRCVISVMQTEAEFLQNCGGQEAYVVGKWAAAATRATNRFLRRKMTEFLQSKGSKAQSRERISGPSGKPRNAVSGVKKPSAGIIKRGVRLFRGIDWDDEGNSDKFCGLLQDLDIKDEGSTPKRSHIGVVYGRERSRPRVVLPSSALSSELRAVQNGGVKKVKRPGTASGRLKSGPPAKPRRDGWNSNYFNTSSSSDAMEEDGGDSPHLETPVSKKVTSGLTPTARRKMSEPSSSATPASKKPGPSRVKKIPKKDNESSVPSTPEPPRSDRTSAIWGLVEFLHSQAQEKDKSYPIVNLAKIAAHALICDPRHSMRCTAMTEEEFRVWGKNFCEWAGEAVMSAESAKDTADLFMGLPLKNKSRRAIWDANWEALGGNQLDAHPRRRSEFLEDILKPEASEQAEPSGNSSRTTAAQANGVEASRDQITSHVSPPNEN